MKIIPLLLATLALSLAAAPASASASAAAAAAAAAAAEPTLADVHAELALVNAKLELAAAKLELAKKNDLLAATTNPPQTPRTAAEKQREKLDDDRKDQLREIVQNEASIEAIAKKPDFASAKNVAAKKALEELNASIKINLAVTDTALTALDRAKTVGQAGATAAQIDAAKAGDFTKKAVADLAKAVDDEVEAELRRTFLRKHGFAINLGYGYVADLANYAPDVQVRYNFFQSQQIDDVRKDRQLLAKGRSKRGAGEKWAEAGFGGSLLTDVSGWIGYPLQKLDNKARTVGAKTYTPGEVKEAPLTLGLGIGLGNGHEFSSAVSLNAGVALFNSGAYKRSDLYVGVSVDAVLFKAIGKSLAEVTGK